MNNNYVMENGWSEEAKAILSTMTEKYNAREDTLRMYSEIIAERLKVSYLDAINLLLTGKEKYHIPFTYYVNHLLFLPENEDKCKESELIIKKARKDRRRRIKEITGYEAEKVDCFCDDMERRFGLSEKELLDMEAYNKTDSEIEAFLKKREERNNRRIERISAETGWDNYKVRKHIAKCKILYGIANGYYECSKCYERTDEELSHYANLRDTRILSEKYLKVDVNYLNDKVLFDKTFSKYLGRRFFVNRDSSFEDFKSFIGDNKSVFLKPVDLHGGYGTRIIDVSANLEEMYNDIMSMPKVLLEEVIKQHWEMAEFYSESVNTVRLFTIVHEGEFHAFAAFVRFGVKGITDNISSGGIGCGLDARTGEIITDAMSRDGKVYKTHPISKKAFRGFYIPYWSDILQTTKEAMLSLPGLDYVGWDIAIKDDGVVIVEGNSIPCLSTYQSFFTPLKKGMKETYEKYL